MGEARGGHLCKEQGAFPSHFTILVGVVCGAQHWVVLCEKVDESKELQKALTWFYG